MGNAVYNNSIGVPSSLTYPNLNGAQTKFLLATLFEQLLLFDTVVITTNRVNFALFFLIKNIGVNVTEELLERGYIKFLLWTPVIAAGLGKEGKYDEHLFDGQPPIIAGTFTKEDSIPKNNIDQALSRFRMNRDRKRILKRVAEKNYIVPDGMLLSKDASDLVISAYESNNLAELGLPFKEESDYLPTSKRKLLLNLSYSAIETAVVTEYNLKSYDNFNHYNIYKSNLDNIGKALEITENSSKILKLENLPDLKTLFINEKIRFEDVLAIRNLTNAKNYRNWINNIDESYDAKEITEEYINQIKGTSSYFAKNEVKLVKNVLTFVISTALGTAIAGPIGTLAGFGLGLLDTFILENIIKGKNPSMFVDDLKKKIENG